MKAHKTGEEFIRRLKDLTSKRGNFPTLWDSCATHILPDRAEFLTKKEIGDENVTIFETAAIDANFILAGWIWSQMTSPSLHWFRASVRNKAKKEMWAVKRWFEETDEIMYSTFSQSNFYDTMSNFYLSMGAIGTVPMFMRSKIAPYRQYFKEYSIRDAFISENQFGDVDTIYRPFVYTVRQCVMEWGKEALSKDVQKMVVDDDLDKAVKILHICEPREDYNRQSDRTEDMPFASVYMEESTKHIIFVGGYKIFPNVVGRFYRWEDSPYARCPGMLALPDIRTADAQDKTNLRAGHKAAEPALNVPADMKGKVRTSPNALNHQGKSGDGITPINLSGGLPFSLEIQDRRVIKIEDKFFKRIIMMLDSASPTYKNIPEILAREQEKMAVIGAPIGRLMHQVLGPIVEWSFMDHLENGMFPEVPAELDGEDLDIEYISPLAMSLKQLEAGGMSRAYELSSAMFELDPTSIDNVDAHKAVREFYTIFGADTLLRSPDAVQQISIQRQQAAQAEQVKQDAAGLAEGTKTLAEADQASGGKLGELLEE